MQACSPQAPKGGYAGVQVKGFVKTPYSGTAPALGYTALAADGNGGVKAAPSGPLRLVLELDTTRKPLDFAYKRKELNP